MMDRQTKLVRCGFAEAVCLFLFLAVIHPCFAQYDAGAVAVLTIGVSDTQVASGIVSPKNAGTPNGENTKLKCGVEETIVEGNSKQPATVASQPASHDHLTETSAKTPDQSGPKSFSSVTNLHEGLVLIGDEFVLGNKLVYLTGGTVIGRGSSGGAGDDGAVGGGSAAPESHNLAFADGGSKRGFSWASTTDNGDSASSDSSSEIFLPVSRSHYEFDIPGRAVFNRRNVQNPPDSPVSAPGYMGNNTAFHKVNFEALTSAPGGIMPGLGGIASGTNTLRGFTNDFAFGGGSQISFTNRTQNPVNKAILISAVSKVPALTMKHNSGAPVKASLVINTDLIITTDVTIGGTQDLLYTGNVSNQGDNNNSLIVTNTGLTTFNGATVTLSGLNAAGTLNVNVAGTSAGVIISNVVQDFPTGRSTPDTLTKSGAGTLTLAGSSANTFSRGLTLNAGTILAAKVNALGAGTLTVNGGTLNIGAFNQTVGAVTMTNGTITGTSGTLIGTSYAIQSGSINAMLGGSGVLTKTTAGTLTLNGNNSFTGGLNLNAGTLLVGNDQAAGRGTLALANGTTISATGGARTLTNNLAIGGTVTFSGTDNLNFTHGFDLGGNRVFHVDNTTTLGGTITGAARSLTMNGAGTLVLGGTSANTFSGGLTVSSGTVTAAKVNALGTGTLTVSGGTLNVGAYSQTVGAVTMTAGTITGASGTLTGTSYAIQAGTISANLGGSGALTKTTTGTLALSGNNTFTGNLNLNAGTLVLGNDQAAGRGTLALANGVTLSATGGARTLTNNLTIGGTVTFSGTNNLTFTSAINLAANRTLTVNNTTTLGGAISGAGRSLTMNGTGTLTLAASNSFTGGLNLTAGTLALGNDRAAGSGTLTLGNGVTIASAGGARTITNNLAIGGDVTFGGSDNLTFTSAISLGANRAFTVANTTTLNGLISGANYSLTKNGAGNLVLGGSSANTFSGGFTLNSGTATAAKINALGTGALTVNNGTLDIGANNQTVGTVTMTGGTMTGTSGTLSGPSFQMQSGTVNASLAGTGSLVKSTTGTVTLSKANSYSGGTTINGGSLLVNNTTGSATGAGAVLVNNGGTLGGIGSIAGQITLNSGGVISPGTTGPGRLGTAGEIWNGGSRYLVKMNSVASGEGAGWSCLSIAGSLTFNTSGNPILLDVRSLALNGTAGLVSDFNNTRSYSWRIAATTGGLVFNPGQNAGTTFSLVLDAFQNNLGGGRFSLGVDNGNKDLMLYFTSVPEPGSGTMLILGFLVFFAKARFARSSAKASKN